MKSLLITGVSGFLGWNIAHAAKTQGWRVHGIFNRHSDILPPCIAYQADLTDPGTPATLLERIKPHAVIHLAAQSQPNICEKNPESTNLINVTVSTSLAQLCTSKDIPFVFTSTDLVFDGSQAPYKEVDPVTPLSHYGRQKATAERLILEINPAATICRMPLMFGDSGKKQGTFLHTMIDALLHNKELTLFIDEYRSPTSGSSAAQGLLFALEKEWKGIYHLGGTDRVSRYELGILLAESLGIVSPHITGILQKEISMPAPRPADVSLDSTKAMQAGYKPLPLKEEFARLEIVRKTTTAGL